MFFGVCMGTKSPWFFSTLVQYQQGWHTSFCYFCDFLLGKLWSVLFRWGVGASPKIDVNKKKSTRWIILVGYVVFVVVFFLYGWWVLSESWHLEKMISFHGPLPTKLLLLKEFMVEINTQLFKCHKPIPVNFQVTWSGWCLSNPVVARFFYRGSWGSPMHMELRNGPSVLSGEGNKRILNIGDVISPLQYASWEVSKSHKETPLSPFSTLLR